MATAFQQLVWGKLTKIPRGRVTTYGDLAAAVGKPGAARAVGTACGANPRLIEVPCHRVVSSTGEVGQYVKGNRAKIKLLESEGVEIKNGRVCDFRLRKHHWR